MIVNKWIVLAASTAVFVAGFVLGGLRSDGAVAHAQAGKHVYELRTYTAPEGKLGDLNARFRNHTLKIFERHGMKNVIYMTPQDAPDSQNTLIYLLEHQNREAAKKSWDAFRTDPEWVQVAKETTANGPITTKVVSVFADPTDYSPMK
jgi:NIPSNAP protein